MARFSDEQKHAIVDVVAAMAILWVAPAYPVGANRNQRQMLFDALTKFGEAMDLSDEDANYQRPADGATISGAAEGNNDPNGKVSQGGSANAGDAGSDGSSSSGDNSPPDQNGTGAS